jgi:ring-1,2-phenylacetyl-CoA epoxidase subunit PaaD
MTDKVLDILSTVKDPEVPALTILDLGIVRDVSMNENQLVVTITPTYTGCPAMDVIEKNILRALTNAGYTNSKVKSILSPPWTTDWISEEGKQKLMAMGISPPVLSLHSKQELLGYEPGIACPHCKSTHTTLSSPFGSTACKALYKCDDCAQPFEHFKCL